MLRIPSVEESALRDTERQLAELCQDTDNIAILLELLLEVGSVRFAKSLLHPQFGLEAEVGIEPISPRFQQKIANFISQSSVLCHYSVLLGRTRLVSVSVSVSKNFCR